MKKVSLQWQFVAVLVGIFTIWGCGNEFGYELDVGANQELQALEANDYVWADPCTRLSSEQTLGLDANILRNDEVAIGKYCESELSGANFGTSQLVNVVTTTANVAGGVDYQHYVSGSSGGAGSPS